MLCDLATLKTALRINSADTSQDTYLGSQLTLADRAIKLYCKSNLETQPYLHFLNGSGVQQQTTRQRPVWSIQGLWLDSKGFGGQGVGAFPANSLLTQGVDYMMKIDGDQGESRSGILYRLSMGFIGDSLAFPRDYYRLGTLTASLPIAWPRGLQNIKISYTAGYGLGAPSPPSAANTLPAGTTLPSELTNACCQLAAWSRTMMPIGVPVDIDTMAQRVADIMTGKADLGNAGLIPMSLLATLAKYREVAMGEP